jgi:hypothetical protein
MMDALVRVATEYAHVVRTGDNGSGFCSAFLIIQFGPYVYLAQN